MEIRRFGTGHRRSDGPPGTVGVAAAPIHSDRLGVIAELALRPKASIAPHSNPNLVYLVVIEGGGFASVGDETVRVAAGEAVVWPPDVVHAAWTETTPMRAIVVEFAIRPDDAAIALIAAEVEAAGPGAAQTGSAWGGGSARASRADGSLAPKPPVADEDHVSAEREPW
jgi:quercetin dioxygenase-like cupin family protein